MTERKVKDRKLKVEQRLGYKIFNYKFDKHNNEFPQNYINKIVKDDSLNFLKKLPNNCIDLVFTSPPYNFGLDYENHDDTYDWKNYFNFLFSVFDECIRVLKYSGRIIINIQPLFSDYIPAHHIISNYFFQKGLIWKGEILWEKNNYNCKYTAWGSWKSPSSPYLKYTWEFLEIFCKGDLKKKGNSEDIDIDAEDFKSWVAAGNTPDSSDTSSWDEVRLERDTLLRNSDWTMITGATVDQAQWAAYRDKLRAIPQTYKDVADPLKDVVWPTVPRQKVQTLIK